MQPELGLFHSLLLSCDLGMANPDAEVFRHAAHVAEREPAQCLFVDDTQLNVDAARELGFRGHHFRDVPGLIEELRAVRASGV